MWNTYLSSIKSHVKYIFFNQISCNIHICGNSLFLEIHSRWPALAAPLVCIGSLIEWLNLLQYFEMRKSQTLAVKILRKNLSEGEWEILGGEEGSTLGKLRKCDVDQSQWAPVQASSPPISTAPHQHSNSRTTSPPTLRSGKVHFYV